MGAKERRKDLGDILPEIKKSGDRTELQKKLERRIIELKEERRKTQSVQDKEKAAKAREARILEFKRQQKEGVVGDGTAKVGKITASVRPSEVAHAIEKNPKGERVRRLESQLRKEDSEKVRLEQAGEDERDDMERDFAMDAAVARARGEKVYDDVNKLRKGAKLRERKKVKGIAKWKDRVDLKQQYQDDRVSRRHDNLQKRVARKKGRKKQRGGFEGKHNGYLNK